MEGLGLWLGGLGLWLEGRRLWLEGRRLWLEGLGHAQRAANSCFCPEIYG